MRYILLVFSTLLLAATLFSPVLADEGDIHVAVATAESQFPDGILFVVNADSPGLVDEVRVFFRKADQEGRSSYRSIDVEPGESVSGETLLPTSGGADFLPPGTKISYHFEVYDKAGAMVRTEEQVFIYEDNRFEWREVSDGLITVSYYGEYVEERARTILEAAKESMDKMVPVLGIAPTQPLRIVAYNNYRHMSAALPFRSQAVREDLQTQGMAFSDERVLLVHAFDQTVTGTTSHEFTHLLVHEAAGPAISQVPGWLNEGLAEYGNIDPTDDYDAALRYGIYTRRLRPLWYQGSFGGSPEDILIAYGQGRSVVNYLIARYGVDKIPELFRTVRQTLDIDAALLRTYGFDQYGLDSEWRTALGLEPLPSPEQLEEQLRGESEAEEPVEEAGPVEETGTDEEEQAPTEPDQESGPAAEGEEPDSAAEDDVEEEPTGGPTQAEGQEEDVAAQPSTGCGAPVGDSQGRTAVGLGMLALVSAPMGLAALPWLRRRTLWRRRRGSALNERGD